MTLEALNLNISTFVALAYNVLQLGDVADKESLKYRFMTDFPSTKRPLN